MIDLYGRDINYLRISITDRCNLRCRYCMPDGISCVPMEEILTYEEIERIAACASALGIRHIKVTGGEPLVRKDCIHLIKRLKNIPGIETVTPVSYTHLDVYKRQLQWEWPTAMQRQRR